MVSTVQYYFIWKYSFLLENLVFGVKTCIFLTKQYFPLEKRIFYKFFSRNTEVFTVKYYFIWKSTLFYLKTSFSVLYFSDKTVFSTGKNGFSISFSLGKLRFPLWNTIFYESALFYLKILFSVLKLVFFWQNGLFHWKKRIFYKFFSNKTEVSTVIYYFRWKCSFLFKTSFSVLKLVFFWQNSVFTGNKRIF